MNDAALDDPWATQREIAEAVGVSRARVSQLLDEDVETVREAYRQGVEVPATPGFLRALGNVLEQMVGEDPAITERLFRSAEDGDVSSVRIELIPPGGRDD